jgi:hypothetical protein
LQYSLDFLPGDHHGTTEANGFDLSSARSAMNGSVVFAGFLSYPAEGLKLSFYWLTASHSLNTSITENSFKHSQIMLDSD